jgi:site-specific DNA-methyltransferase (adenine-specific)
MKEIDDNLVDLVITSPPYNVGIDYGKGREDDKRPFSEYCDFANLVTEQIARVLKSGGRACIEIGGSGRNFPLSWCWQDVAYKNGLGLFREIVLEQRKTNQCGWGSYLKSDNVYTVPNFHLMYVFYKESATKRSSGATDITSEQFVEWTRGLWRVFWRTHAGHPASFPEDIPYRCMKLFGHTTDLVLDPFAGSGTTDIVAEKLGRHWIGIELNPTYVELANVRLEQERSKQPLF